MVWTKFRTNTVDHILFDTERGALQKISSNLTDASANDNNTLTSFNSNGFSLGNRSLVNQSGQDFVSWTFRKEPKFFDIVTWSGNGGGARNISHNLGSAPGMMIVRRYDGTEDWGVYHRRSNNGTNDEQYYLLLHNDQNSSDADYFNDTAPTSTQFTVNSGRNISGRNYIAYLFAHNDGDGGFGPDSEDIIKCDSYTGNGSSTGTVVNLGFEPQFLMIKRAIGGAGPWAVADSMRGVTADGEISLLRWNTDGSEATGVSRVGFTSTGFQLKNSDSDFNNNGDTYIYMAIRRPDMSTPTAASDVFKVDQGHGSNIPNLESGFPVDFALVRQTSADGFKASARLTSGKYLETSSTAAESSNSNYSFDHQDGWFGSALGTSYYSWMWKRARGFCDVVAYTGTGSATTVTHNLGAVPEMMWVKRRSGTRSWFVYHSALGNTGRIKLDKTDAGATGYGDWNSTTPTSSVFSVGSGTNTNGNGETYIAYLFATVAGISKVGSYTGNGSTTGPIVDCGFSNGVEFILIKRTDTTGDWVIYDTARGITSGDDKTLELNTTDAQTEGQVLNSNSSGFQLATGDSFANASSGTYIFYAIAA